jgi:hypothetical protein
MPANMNVDLLVAKMERHPILAKRFEVHAEDADIEVFAGLQINGGQYQMIEMVNHGLAPENSGFKVDRCCAIKRKAGC